MAKVMQSPSFARSHELFQRALGSIPIASQTFSKSHLQLPRNHAPLFIERAEGAWFHDVDGNAYVDLVMGLGPMTLGYCDEDVDAAIRAQLENGIVFSLPSSLEMEVAEKLVELIPCAEMVRFGKNGSDATSAAIRLARAHTGRERVMCCGYHGWHDWYIGSTSRHLGVPDAVRDLTVSAPFNDVNVVEDRFRAHPGEFAALILEPASVALPDDGYLTALKDLCDQHGALLIFDEVVTGFRYHMGGAQTLYGVTPDLTCFGKGMANGMPLSAVVGRRDVMQRMEDIFFSGTFGGECLSLAAALATIEKLERTGTPDYFWHRGASMRRELNRVIDDHGLGDALAIAGEDCHLFLVTKDTEAAPAAKIRTFMLAELIREGVFTLGAVMLCRAFGDAEQGKLTGAFEGFASRLRYGLEKGTLDDMMYYPVIEPVFSVRN